MLCAHTGMCVYPYVLGDIRAGVSVKLTSATGLFPPREVATHTTAYVRLVDNKISCLVLMADLPHQLLPSVYIWFIFVCL